MNALLPRTSEAGAVNLPTRLPGLSFVLVWMPTVYGLSLLTRFTFNSTLVSVYPSALPPVVNACA